MPVHPEAVGAVGEPFTHRWDSTAALLYALGVGAGAVDPFAELNFTTENSAGVTQQVLPTMAVVLGVGGTSALGQIGTFNPALLVHGGQAITLHRPIPVSGEVRTTGEITALWDKGSGAVVEITSRSIDTSDDQPLFDQVTSIFLRGEGGFGGDRGPAGGANAAPDRAPDHVVAYPTRPDQALLYRLSGDRNPLHADPTFAERGGFDRPILHGLCTYGFTGRALLHTLCGSDPDRFRSMDGRFSSPVLPGETLAVSMWETGDGEAIFQTTGSDGRVVLDNGKLGYTPA